MIKTHDRSGWFGASDTARVMASWDTKTFAEWWAVKCGWISKDFCTKQMLAGTYYEHRILDSIGVSKRDRQIKNKRLLLRVNLDGEDRQTIYEVKTHGRDFKVTRAYWMQCQVEMFAAGKKCVLVSYRLNDEDYSNFFNEIDSARIAFHPVKYDAEWIESEYLPRLKELARALRKGELPDEAKVA